MRRTPFYSTALGAAYLGDSLALMKELDDRSVNLVVTSPPFALTFKKEFHDTRVLIRQEIQLETRTIRARLSDLEKRVKALEDQNRPR